MDEFNELALGLDSPRVNLLSSKTGLDFEVVFLLKSTDELLCLDLRGSMTLEAFEPELIKDELIKETLQ